MQETTNAKPAKPIEDPKAKVEVAIIGEMACARAAMDCAAPNVPPCAVLGAFVEISVLIVIISIPNLIGIMATIKKRGAR